MSKLSKRAISILVIAILALSFVLPLVSVSAVLTEVKLDKYSGDKGDTITVSGIPYEVTSGATVEIYWDTAIGVDALLLNSTTGKADGSWECTFKVPEAVDGTHFVWAKDLSGPFYKSSTAFTVVPLIKLSPSSGLPLDPVTVTGYGFSESEDVRVYFGATATKTDTLTGTGSLKTFPTAYPIVPGTETVTIVSSAVTGETVTLSGTGAGPYFGKLLYSPVDMSATITVSAAWAPDPVEDVVMTDSDGDDALESVSARFSAGTIDYATGDISFTFVAAPDVDPTSATADYDQDLSDYTIDYVAGSITFDVAPVFGASITIDYSYAPATVDVTVGTPSTDSVGSFSTTFKVPEGVPRQPYIVTVYDEAGINDDFEFKVGAGISVTPEEGSSGVIVTISGRGFDRALGVSESISVIVDSKIAYMKDGTTSILLGAEVTTFSEDWIIPTTTSEGSKDLVVLGSVTGPVETTFEVNGLTAIKLSPGYGPPGGSVEIKGYNFTQISGTVVTLDFGVATGGVDNYVTFETDSNGEFSDTLRIPAIDYDIHALEASDLYGTYAAKNFRIGIMIIILNPSYGPTGSLVSLTGIGFTQFGTWNATMDGVAITDESVDIGAVETISESLFIPTVPVDTYEITVLDIKTEIDLYEIFHVTATTEAFSDPASAPNGYDVIFKGSYFAQDEGAKLDFILYNSTHDWDITDEVDLYDPDAVDPDPKYTDLPAELDEDGNFTAWWTVWDKEELSLGCYKVNVTDEHDLFAQINFCVCEERIYIEPRKVKFDRGDTVQFDINNDFCYDDSYMKIWDPYDSLYWVTKSFDEAKEEWLKVETLYTVPYYAQTSGGNPMTLAPDAPMGEWFWAFYTFEDKQLVNGTFEVGKSAAAILSEQLGALSGDMSALTDQIDDVTGDIDALSGEIGDVVTDVEGMIDDITADLAEELAGVATDTEAAVDALEGSIGDIAAAQNALADELEDMGQDTAGAEQAAKDAKDSVQGLTTIVYGAIACSLIAALAAVVSLMQISKKIA